ncbi:MAG: hypothetical protein WD532_00805 [Acidimicrobiia bacterium]
MTTTTAADLAYEVTPKNPGFNRPQKLGRALWAPMWAMAVMGFVAAIIAAGVRADAVASRAAEATIAAQAHLVTGFMFVGFASVFAAISFAIARILGVFRDGGGSVQETLGVKVHTLKMPATAKAFIGLMMMAMMAILIAVVIHFVTAAGTAAGTISVSDAETTAIALEAVRRLGVAVYLVAIGLGLATITNVLRFQSIRLRELAGPTNTD